MKYTVHANLVSFYAMATALFQEIVEGGTSLGQEGRVVLTEELINIADTASLLGKIALHDAADAQEHAMLNRSLTSLASRADNAFYGDANYPEGMQFEDFYPYFESIGMIGSLEADPMLFASKPGEDDAATEARMRDTGFSILLNEDDGAQALLGLSLVVAAAALAIRNGRANTEDVSYPPTPDKLRYVNGYVEVDNLKTLVFRMAQAIVTRVSLPQ